MPPFKLVAEENISYPDASTMDPPGGKYSSSALDDFTAICCPPLFAVLVVVVVIRGFNFCVVVFLSFLLLLLTDDDEAATTTKDPAVKALISYLLFMRARSLLLYIISKERVLRRAGENEPDNTTSYYLGFQFPKRKKLYEKRQKFVKTEKNGEKRRSASYSLRLRARMDKRHTSRDEK